MKVIIAGGRDFNDYNTLFYQCNSILDRVIPDVEIVSGEAAGADCLGEKYAHEMGFSVKKFPADWISLGKAAGPIRNKQMAEYADALIAFWDGRSKGTKNMINNAIKQKLKVKIIHY